MERAAKEVILHCGPHNSEPNVMLMGQLSSVPNAKGLVVLLHGWEGSQDSTYVISTARQLYDQGYSIFRLNYRDHGPTHHLNKGIFNSSLFGEVFEAVRQITQRLGLPTYLIGFSLGGNFCLRIAREIQSRPIEGLRHIFPISPVIDPLNAAPMVDENPFIRRYFLKKWTTSLAKKQAAFPGLYDFGDMGIYKTVNDFSAKFVPLHTEYASADDYFMSYGIENRDLANAATPMTIITSADDPVMPAEDVLKIQLHANTQLYFLRYGGHNGFFQSLLGPTWYDVKIAKVLAEYAAIA